MAQEQESDLGPNELELELKREQLRQLRDDRKTKWFTPSVVVALLGLIGTGVWSLYLEAEKYSDAYQEIKHYKKVKADYENVREELQLKLAQKEDINRQLKGLQGNLNKLRSKLAEEKLAAVKVKLTNLLDKAEIRIDTVWRLCSHRHGLVSHWLDKVEEWDENSSEHDFSEQDELIGDFNSIFVPLIDADEHISSMMIVGYQGFEYLALDERVILSRDDEENRPKKYYWRNRLNLNIASRHHAREWFWQDDKALDLNRRSELDVTGISKLVVEDCDGKKKPIDWDPRRRRYALPWLCGVLTGVETDESKQRWESTNTYWTRPYVFFTTKNVGVTASRGFKHSGKKYVVAVDFTLTELSAFTTRLKVGERGVVFIFTDDGAVIGLPHNTDKFGVSSIKAKDLHKKLNKFFNYLAKNPTKPDELPTEIEIDNIAKELNMSFIKEAFLAWKNNKTTTKTTIDFFVKRGSREESERWRGLFEPYSLGNRRVWIAVIAPITELEGPRAPPG